jgi:hypothetical protein
VKRWTDQEIEAASKKYFFDGTGPGKHELIRDKLPLPSSFTDDGLFIEARLDKQLNKTR